VVDTTVEREPASFPCGALTAGKVMHLENLRVETAHLGIATSGQAAYTSTYYYDVRDQDNSHSDSEEDTCVYVWFRFNCFVHYS
jgi:hypothetical protein